MSLSRRKFFALAGTGATGAIALSALETFYAQRVFAAGPYGPLVADPQRVLDLPAGFSYVRLSETGQRMSDGYTVPGGHDGMGAFPGPNGNTILIRNHELATTSSTAVGAPNASKYDTTAKGGTTTLEVTPNRTLVRHFGSLAGTTRNCSGGITPWGTWLSCEETFETTNGKKHGYVFEVSASANGFVTPTPLVAMGRFNHEAAAVDPNTGYVYLTEDRGDSLFYRFVPNVPGNLSAGGTLSALRIPSRPQVNTKTGFTPGQSFTTDWVTIATPDPATDIVRTEGFNKGAARFSRGEGMVYSGGSIYFCCTDGGSTSNGQVWRYTPATNTLQLFIQPENSAVLQGPDNVVVAPTGDLFLCEDGSGTDFIVGVSPNGTAYQFARNRLNTSEFAGVCFSPDGRTMFVNIQTPGITFAIQGPW
jgi:secreted PhoX family phosphatase